VRVGIVVPAYNVAPFIATALGSVLGQSHTDWRMVVVDDGSTDATASVVAGFNDPRLHVIRQPNRGVSAARNRGIAEIEADAVLFLDADDWLAPDALARLTETLDATRPRAVAAYGAFAFVAENAEPGASPVWFKRGPFPSGDILERLLAENLFANGGHLLIRGGAVAQAGLFRESIGFGEDWDYWIRLARLGDFAVVPGTAPLLLVRQRRSGAYLRMATDPAAFDPCMDAIFGSDWLRDRLGAVRCAGLRRQAVAENDWIIGRELIRHGLRGAGLGRLVKSVRARPSLKRLALVAMATAAPITPKRLHGPFRAYQAPAAGSPTESPDRTRRV
jgi:glycosyltransferase involved in cell wall biosynthesis